MRNKNNEIKIGAILSYVASAIGIISSLLFNPIIIKNLGKNEYGLYETIGSFVNYLAILDLGFSAVVVRYVAKYQAENEVNKRDEFLYTARRIYQILVLAILAIGSVMYCFIGTIFGTTFSNEELRKAHIMFIIVLMTTCVSIYSQVYGGALTGIERFIVPRLIRIVKIILGKIIAIVIVIYGADSIGYTFDLFAFEMLSFVFLKVYSTRFVKFKKCRVAFSEIKELLVFTSFLLLQALASQLYWQIDKVVLGAMIGTEIVAVYSISLTLESLVSNISGSIKGMLLPRATKLSVEKDKQDSLMPFMVKGGRIVLIGYAIMYIGIACFGREFITLWLGVEFIDAYMVYIILGLSALLPSILGVGETVLRAYNKHQFLSRVSIIAALINVGLTIIGIKTFGYIGAAYATAAGLIIGSTLFPLLYYKKVFPFSIRLFLKGVFSKLVVCFLIVTLFGVMLNYAFPVYAWSNLFFKAVIMVFVYILMLYIYGFTSYEKNIFKSYFGFLNKKRRLDHE